MNEKLISPLGTELFCENIVNTTYEQLSEENIRIFRDRLLDLTGCLFGGALVAEDAFLEKRLKDWGGKPEASLFCIGRAAPPAQRCHAQLHQSPCQRLWQHDVHGFRRSHALAYGRDTPADGVDSGGCFRRQRP